MLQQKYLTFYKTDIMILYLTCIICCLNIESEIKSVRTTVDNNRHRYISISKVKSYTNSKFNVLNHVMYVRLPKHIL